MLDIKFIRENAKQVKAAAKNKNIKVDIDELLRLDNERKELQQKIDELRMQRNQLAEAGKGSKPTAKQIAEGKKIKEEIAKLEEEYKNIDGQYQELMWLVPQIPSPETPLGKDETGNQELRRWGKIPKFNFPVKDHIELGKNLDIIDLERGVKVHGFRGYFLKNEGALLAMAIVQHAIQKMVKRGFTFMINPVLVKDFALYGSGHFPFARDEIFQIASGDNGDKMYLAGTAEPSLLAYYAEERLKEEDLPVKLCGFSACFRSEVGSYGKDTKGLYRVNEFMKVEQIVLCANNYKISMKFFTEMLAIAEEMLQDLKLPYRVVNICTGDMGAGKYYMNDIETWMPSRANYGETHSCSNLGDWQARRLNIKYKNKAGQTLFAHALNNTAIALPRILIALLENLQQADGSVKIPAILHQYLPPRMKTIVKK